MRKSVSFYKPLTFHGISDIITIEFESERQNAVYRILIVEDDEGIAQRLHMQRQDSEFARRTLEDLMRIERYVEMVMGYTGYHGRCDKKASGIGLYLCRRICSNLGHMITANSSLEHGTVIRIRFRGAHPL